MKLSAHPLLIMAAITVVLSASSCRNIEHSENVTSEIEAAQMEGRNAARLFASETSADSAELQHKIEAARAPKAHYDSLGETEKGAAFDSTFKSTVRTIRPDIAKKIHL